MEIMLSLLMNKIYTDEVVSTCKRVTYKDKGKMMNLNRKPLISRNLRSKIYLPFIQRFCYNI